MKKYIPKIFVLAPVLVIICAITYFVDPENRFNSEKYASGVADYMLQGKNVTDVYNYDVRLLQKHFIAGLKSAPDVVILGSSRELIMNKSFFSDTNQTVINSCANSATIEDEMAIYDMYLKRGWHPKKLYIGIDPYYFNDNSTQLLYGSIREYYYDMCEKVGSSAAHSHEMNFKYGKYKELVSPGYLQKSMLYWISTGNNHTYIPTDKTENISETKLVDGSITYSKMERDRNQLEIDDVARGYVSDVMFYFRNYNRLSPNLTDKFEKFIDYVKNQGVEVNILFMPYHPICYQKMITDPQYKMVVATEDYVKRVAHDKHVNFYGALNPSVFHLKNTDFYDGLHLKKEGLMEVMREKR